MNSDLTSVRKGYGSGALSLWSSFTINENLNYLVVCGSAFPALDYLITYTIDLNAVSTVTDFSHLLTASQGEATGKL